MCFPTAERAATLDFGGGGSGCTFPTAGRSATMEFGGVGRAEPILRFIRHSGDFVGFEKAARLGKGPGVELYLARATGLPHDRVRLAYLLSTQEDIDAQGFVPR